MKLLFAYLFLVNITAFLVMGIDKRKAHRHRWRISENSIFFIAIAGGGLGVFLGMRAFHHKTRHLKFTLGIPVAVIANILLFGYLLNVILQM